jgi:hypothetical protein
MRRFTAFPSHDLLVDGPTSIMADRAVKIAADAALPHALAALLKSSAAAGRRLDAALERSRLRSQQQPASPKESP